MKQLTENRRGPESGLHSQIDQHTISPRRVVAVRSAFASAPQRIRPDKGTETWPNPLRIPHLLALSPSITFAWLPCFWGW